MQFLKAYYVPVPLNAQLTKNFTLDEFRCKDGTGVPYDLIPNVMELAENLQVLRDYLNGEGRPKHVPKHIDIKISLNSGYRNPTYNDKVGGEDESTHMKAMAGDFTSKYFTPAQLHAACEKLIAAGKMKQGGLGLYPGFLHYDIRGYKARWGLKK